MEPKFCILIGSVAVLAIIVFIVYPAVFDTLDSRADDIPSNSAWNALDDDTNLLKLLPSVLVLVAIIVGALLYRRDIGGGGV